MVLTIAKMNDFTAIQTISQPLLTDIVVAEGVQSGTSSQLVRLPATCSRGYNAGNSNLRSGILYGGRSIDCSLSLGIEYSHMAVDIVIKKYLAEEKK